METSPCGVGPHTAPISVRLGSAIIAPGRAAITLPELFLTCRRLTLTWLSGCAVIAALAMALLTSSSDRSHEPALAVTSKQPVRSVAIAIGSSPMLIEFLPGVSLSASSTSTEPDANAFDGPVDHCATATVPGADCRMKPYQVVSPAFSCPAGASTASLGSDSASRSPRARAPGEGRRGGWAGRAPRAP